MIDRCPVNSAVIAKYSDCLTFEDSVKVLPGCFSILSTVTFIARAILAPLQTFYGEFRLTMPIAR